MLNELKRPAGSRRKSIQIGRGNGSGRGNYSTRGLKGQKARTWFSQKPGFEAKWARRRRIGGTDATVSERRRRGGSKQDVCDRNGKTCSSR